MDIEKPKFGTQKWFENYWYHYKWHTIVGLFLLVMVVTMVHDLVVKEKYDAEMMITGRVYTDYTFAERLALLLEQYAEDYDGNGEINVSVSSNLFPSDEVQAEMFMAAQTRLMAELSDGLSMVLFLDDYTFDMIERSSDGSFFADLSAYSGKAFDGGKKIRLSDTPLGTDPGIAPYAEKYFLTLRRSDMRAANRNEKAVANYQNQLSLLENLLADHKTNPIEIPPPEENPLLFGMES
ncbi:MAG: hypothetical protein HFG26_02520 [Provencibacterium sp.]|jgi:hypothetical protein|nr:hypothetical protein [Provencibacterium sp.]